MVCNVKQRLIDRGTMSVRNMGVAAVVVSLLLLGLHTVQGAPFADSPCCVAAERSPPMVCVSVQASAQAVSVSPMLLPTLFQWLQLGRAQVSACQCPQGRQQLP
jgi:hypothetical protein